MDTVSVSYLRQLRTMHKLTLTDVSNDTGLSIALLSKVERGQVTVSVETAKALSDYYGVKVKPARIIISFTTEPKTLAPQYKIENSNLKKENKELKKEIALLKQELQKIKNSLSELLSGWKATLIV